MSLPLDGIKVIEIGNFIAGPFCGMLLGDMGADVIKIERPKNGDQTRAMPPMVQGYSASFAALNRNKRSLVLDLKQAQAIGTVWTGSNSRWREFNCGGFFWNFIGDWIAW